MRRRVGLEHRTHIPDPHGPPLAIIDLEVRRISIQRVAQDELFHNGQRGPVDPPGQLPVLGILRVHLHVLDTGVPGDGRDGCEPVQRGGVRAVDGAVADFGVRF